MNFLKKTTPMVAFLSLSWLGLGCGGSTASKWKTVFNTGPLTVYQAYVEEGNSVRSIYHVLSSDKNFSDLRIEGYHWCNYEVKKDSITIVPAQLGQQTSSGKRLRLIEYDTATSCGRPSFVLVYGLNNMEVAEKTEMNTRFVKGMYIRSKRNKENLEELNRQLEIAAQAEIRKSRGFLEKLDKVKAESREISRRASLSQQERFCEDNPTLCNPALAKSAKKEEKEKSKKKNTRDDKSLSNNGGKKSKKTEKYYTYIACTESNDRRYISNIFSYEEIETGFTSEEINKHRERIKNTLPRAERKIGINSGTCFWPKSDPDKSKVSADREETLKEYHGLKNGFKKMQVTHFNIE